jgi:hypothetical protein
MTKFLASEDFYKSELDELYKILNEVDKRIASAGPEFASAYSEVRATCLYRIGLVEGWLSEIAALKIN